MAVGGLCPRSDVEILVGAGTGEMAALHVANSVATCFAGGESHCRKVVHHVGDLIQLDEVELEVLSRGDVSPATAVALDNERQHLELFWVHRSVGNLDPNHLVGSALSLSVDAVG